MKKEVLMSGDRMGHSNVSDNSKQSKPGVNRMVVGN